MTSQIFMPMIAQVALTAAVWVRMYVVRISEIRRRTIDPQSLSTSRTAAGVLESVAPADNLRNQFQIPVLFFAICLSLALTGGVSQLQLGLAWTFVILRTAHSVIHLTYNRVIHRFMIYTLSTLCVFTMWGLFAVFLLGDG